MIVCQAVLLCFDGGNNMSNAEIKKGKHVYEVTDLQLLPSQADLRRRATYRLAASGQKRRRTSNENIGSLAKICGIEHAMFCHHPEHPLDAKPLQFISAPGLLACIFDFVGLISLAAFLLVGHQA